MLCRDAISPICLMVGLGLFVCTSHAMAAEGVAATKAADAKELPAKEAKADKTSLKEKEGEKRDSDKKDGDKKDSEKRPGPLAITPEREATALAFVQQHHPELVQLLTYLKENQPKEYLKAVRELFRAHERLAMIKDRDSELHDLELKAWKLRSRVQLISARVRMTPQDDQLRQQLKQTLADHVDVRRSLVELEIQRAKDRLHKLQSQAQELSRDKNQVVERQLRELTSVGPKGGPKGKDKEKVKEKDKD